ncbi:GGDEF domain-containing protein [Devosia pacifica]|uniref:diguanylate cyclase n=1 Tax=Devosia pacifica TaxID=1335967 RepID=A0A918VZ95_9HYPH|nr:GGDEF domain-containing protein [Devosia pacifica]GHA37933.1 GGDEF domain-containing protein [Devosia pacifica]
MTAAGTSLPPQAWSRIRVIWLIMTVVSVVVSVLLTTLILNRFSAGISIAGLMAATVMPLTLGSPLIFYMTLKHEQIRHANARLTVLATIDWLTGCLNRGAFSDRVETELATGVNGALLIADADAFKLVNDKFGHQQGDVALRLIADAIKSAVPQTAHVGRLGGEEFGVFVAGTTAEEARELAADISHAVRSAHFAPTERDWPLSISIGIAQSHKGLMFDELYRLADAGLYARKAERALIRTSEAASASLERDAA